MNELQKLEVEADELQAKLFRYITTKPLDVVWAAEVKAMTVQLLGMREAIKKAHLLTGGQEPVFIRFPGMGE